MNRPLLVVRLIVMQTLFLPSLALAQMQAQEGGAGKTWMVTASPSRALLGRFDINLKNQGAIGIEGGYMGPREELQSKEVEENPGDSLVTYGREFKILVSRFSQPTKMAGFFWGLGVGQRSVEADWRKSPYSDAPEQFGIADDEGKINHRLKITGTLLEGRAGYRYVADAGFAAGIFLNISHHNNRVQDRDSVLEAEAADHIGSIADHDAYALSRRVTSSLAPRVELGWAF